MHHSKVAKGEEVSSSHGSAKQGCVSKALPAALRSAVHKLYGTQSGSNNVLK